MINSSNVDNELELAEEAYLAVYLIEFGLFSLNRIENAEHLPLMLLSNGIERMLKLIILLDFFKTKGRFPNDTEYHNKKWKTHDICFLLTEFLTIGECAQYNRNGEETEDLSFLNFAKANRLKEMLQIFSKYGDQGRYHNLNVLVNASCTEQDPVEAFEGYRNNLIKEACRTCNFNDCKTPEDKNSKVMSLANQRITGLLQRFTRALCRLITCKEFGEMADKMRQLLADFLELKDSDLEELRFPWLPGTRYR